MVNLESDQARWATECCKGGNCPVCNPGPEEEEQVLCSYCGEPADIDDYGLQICNGCLDDNPDIKATLNAQAANDADRWA